MDGKKLPEKKRYIYQSTPAPKFSKAQSVLKRTLTSSSRDSNIQQFPIKTPLTHKPYHSSISKKDYDSDDSINELLTTPFTSLSIKASGSRRSKQLVLSTLKGKQKNQGSIRKKLLIEKEPSRSPSPTKPINLSKTSFRFDCSTPSNNNNRAIISPSSNQKTGFLANLPLCTNNDTPQNDTKSTKVRPSLFFDLTPTPSNNKTKSNLFHHETVGKKEKKANAGIRFVGETPIPTKFRSVFNKKITPVPIRPEKSIIEKIDKGNNLFHEFNKPKKLFHHIDKREEVDLTKQDKKPPEVIKKKRKSVSLYPSTLLLPFKFNLLIKKFNAVETTIAMYNGRNIFYIPFSDVKHSVEIITKKTFYLSDLQRIISVVPEFYLFEWRYVTKHHSIERDWKLVLVANDYEINDDDEKDDKLEKKGKTKTGLKFMSISKMRERRCLFEYGLIKFVQKQHHKWLVDNVLVEFDPLETGAWHKRFELEKVDDIPLFEISSKPEKKPDDLQKEMEKEKIKKNEYIQNETDKLRKKQQKGKGSESENDEPVKKKAISPVIPISLRHLSPSIIAKIKEKEKSQKSDSFTKNKELESKDELRRYEQLPYMINLMRGIYVSMKKSSIEYSNLIDIIQKRHKNSSISKDEIYEQLKLLASLKSSIFKLKKGTSMTIAKLNKNADMTPVFKEIQDFIH